METIMNHDHNNSENEWLNEWINNLTIKSPITTAADNIHKYFFIVFQRK